MRGAGLQPCCIVHLAGALASSLARRSPLSRRSPAPHVVFVTGDDEYRSEITMPMIAAILEKRHGLRTSVAYAGRRRRRRTTSKGSRRSTPPT